MTETLTNPEINAEVATRVMGWTNLRDEGWYDDAGDFIYGPVGQPPDSEKGYRLPAYSTDPAAMVAVLEKLVAQGFHVAVFWKPERLEVHIYNDEGDGGSGYAETLPRATAEAALKAMETP